MSSSFLISLVIFLFPIMQILEAHERSTTRRQLGPESCRTGNPIDDCWRCDSEWESNRKALADCAVGFGRNAVGGRDGEIYIVKSKDDDPVDPIPGSLRYAVIQEEPLWIIFDHDMVINLKQELVMNSYKTIDGRGFNVQMSNGPCISIYNVSNIIIHNIYIHDCVPAGSAVVRDSPKHYGPRGRSDGDGISIFGSRDIWIDHCTFSHCYDGLIDIVYGSTAITISDGDGISIFGSRDIWIDHCTFSHCYDGLIDIVYGSTAITISNNYMFHHNEVMLMGHSDDFSADKNMQVTIAFNFFGDGLVQRMPRCRHGFFHIVNNIYTGWEMYAIGGSANPTINSQGNVFIASNDESTKEVTKHEIISEDDEWKKWNWRSEGDLMLNGAFFTPSGQETPASYMKASSMVARPATSLLTASSPSAGALSCRNSQPC